MLKEDNETLCRVGPETPMGQVFRRYWTPIAVAERLSEPDGDPQRVAFCGERFVLFRDSDGKLGLLDELCAHRGASLALGRNEGCGIRCLYHGWKFAHDGALMEAPNYPDPGILGTIKAPAYPVREAGGLIWGYFGPKEKEPPFPDYAFFDVPVERIYIARVDLNANYLQVLEGGLDSSHVTMLHSNASRPGWRTGSFSRTDDPNNPSAMAVDDTAPRLEIEATAFGFHCAARRKSENATESVRVVPFILPSVRMIPAQAREAVLFEVPLDDEHTSTYLIAHGPYTDDKARNRRLSGIDDPSLWSEDDYIWRGSWENNFGQDRSIMAENWTGLRGLEQEDAAMTLSMGVIRDRTREHLGPSDAAIVQMRRTLLDAAKRVQAGEDPPALPSLAGVNGLMDTEIAPGQRWQDVWDR